MVKVTDFEEAKRQRENQRVEDYHRRTGCVPIGAAYELAPLPEDWKALIEEEVHLVIGVTGDGAFEQLLLIRESQPTAPILVASRIKDDSK